MHVSSNLSSGVYGSDSSVAGRRFHCCAVVKMDTKSSSSPAVDFIVFAAVSASVLATYHLKRNTFNMVHM